MTNEEIVERLDTAIDHAEKMTGATLGELRLLKAMIDPPRPEPREIVLWRFSNCDTAFANGIVAEGGDGIINSEQEFYEWCDIEYKPARIAGPMQVIVDIPPLKKWGSITELHIQVRSPQGGVTFSGVTFSDVIITRLDAENREAEG